MLRHFCPSSISMIGIPLRMGYFMPDSSHTSQEPWTNRNRPGSSACLFSRRAKGHRNISMSKGFKGGIESFSLIAKIRNVGPNHLLFTTMTRNDLLSNIPGFVRDDERRMVVMITEPVYPGQWQPVLLRQHALFRPSSRYDRRQNNTRRAAKGVGHPMGQRRILGIYFHGQPSGIDRFHRK